VLNKSLVFIAAVCLLGAVIWLARRPQADSSQSGVGTAMPQDAYVWQRQWTPAVVEAIAQQRAEMRRFVVLAAEISLRESPGRVTAVAVDYAGLRRIVDHVGLAVRIGPISGRLADRAFLAGSPQANLICETVRRAVGDCRSAGLAVDEVEIDFDCAESRLAGYANWVGAVKETVGGEGGARGTGGAVVITALPSWLKHAEFAELAKSAGAFVLQVHSLHAPSGPGSAMTLCDPDEARAAVERAGKVGVPFRVALPTYGYMAGFSPAGKLLGLSAEGPAPQWPSGAILRVMRSDPAAIAGLVREWSAHRPGAMLGIIWYRMPVAGDAMNWPAATLAAVMAGREPRANVIAEARPTSPGLIDLFLRNTGDGDGSLRCRVTITGADEDQVLAADGIGGFGRLDPSAGGITFQPVDIAGADGQAPAGFG
jgi:hypothetical protein